MKKGLRAVAFVLCMSFALASMAAPNAATKVANGNIDFGFALYGKLKDKTENVVYSPLSLSVALQMTAMGARGNTLRQMQKALKISGSSMQDVSEYNKDLLLKLQISTRQAGAPVVSIANGMFVKNDFALNDTFANAAKAYYESEMQRVDFADPATVVLVNNWISGKTQGKISKLFDKFDEATALTLVNTVYFQGDWMHEFSPDMTTDGVFKGVKGDQTAKMMYSSRSQAYYEGKNYQAVYLPYKDERIGMVIALPKGKTTVDAMMRDFSSAAKWQKLASRLSPREVNLSLPRFSAQSSPDVVNALKALGMNDAFTAKADLSGIAGAKGDLLVSDVKHKAIIEVAEKGTTAAAATGVEIMVTSMPMETLPAVMTVDHPFFFAVVNKNTNTILFMGVMNNL